MHNYIEIICDSAHGIHIPNIMVQRLKDHGWIGIEQVDLDILLVGYYHDSYWHSWHTVLENAEYTDDDGNQWSLHHDGDLFAVRCDIPDYMVDEFFGN